VSGVSTERALEAVYHVTLDSVTADMRARLGRPNLPLMLPPVTSAPAIRVEAYDERALLAGLRGTIAFQRGDQATALSHWKKAIELGTDDAGLCFRYAVLTEDRAALEKAVALDPALDDARYKLALMEKSEGHAEAAVTHLRAMHDVAASRAFLYWMSLSDALLELGRRAEAKQAAVRAASAASTDAERRRASELEWMAETELAVEFNGREARTIRVPVNAPRNPFVEAGDRVRSAEATLEHVECEDRGLRVKVRAGGNEMTLAVPDPSRVQIRNAGGIEFELTCGPQQGRNVLVEYTAAGVLRGLELR
jgi:tetratricopeptide (TPR) repeat protein